MLTIGIWPWGQALGPRRQQQGGSWHSGLPGHPHHGGHRPSVPAPRDLLLARAGRASSIICQRRGRRNTQRYGVPWGDVGWCYPARGWGQSPGGWVAVAWRKQACCSRQPCLRWERGAFVRLGMCVPARLRHGRRDRECVTAIWGRPRGPARAERASPGCRAAGPAAATAGEITSR